MNGPFFRAGRRFRFDYRPGAIRFGTGCVADLDAELEAGGFEHALVVCGATVGNTPAVIDPVVEGLGDRLAGVFAETTPQKRLATAYAALEAMERNNADVLVGLGGGSSLDVAKVASVLAAAPREPSAVRAELAETGSITVPSEPLVPLVAVPTTLAGAALSFAAGVTASLSPADGDEIGRAGGSTVVGGSVSDPRLMPHAIVSDPALVATTPREVLAGSAMNGFDKGIESLYARTATSITDATAVRGLRLLGDGLRALGEQPPTPRLLEPIVEGLLLVQYGVSRPDASTLSIVHAFGHGLTRTTALQQGIAHAIVVPHVLRYVFDRVDGRRDLLAAALAHGDESDPAEAAVGAVEEVRDALGLPARLRDVDGPDPEAFPDVATVVIDDRLMANAPAGLDVTVEDVEAVLHTAY